MNWRTLRADIGVVGRVRCEPTWRLDWLDPARLLDCDLWFVWTGRGTMKLADGEEIDLHAGICLWMRPGRTYQAIHDPADPLGVTFIHFNLWRSANRKVPVGELPMEVNEVHDFAFIDAATHRIVSLLRDCPEGTDLSSRRFEAESLLLSVLAALSRHSEEELGERLSSADLINQRKIASAVSMITEHPATLPVISELARQFGYSTAHFSRLFRENMGEPPQAFIIKTRLQRARQLLTESTLSIGEIAEMLGYPDVFFFSRQFKAKNDQSPSEFRQSKKE